MRVLFLGYQSIGHAGLKYLVEQNEELVGVVTHRDHPNETIWWPRLSELASVLHFEDLDFAGLERLIDQVRPEILLSFYFRKMIPTRILSKVERGGLNMHGSLLPKYRGRAPANWVLVNGESETGMTLHEMVKRADAGPIVDRQAVPIDPRETIATLYPKLVAATRAIMQRAWPLVRQGRERRTPQDESQATYFGGRTPQDGEIHWDWPARRVDCLVRAVTKPYPGAFTKLEGRKLLIWEGCPIQGSGAPGSVIGPSTIACGEGAYRIQSAQFEGGPVLAEVSGKGKLG